MQTVQTSVAIGSRAQIVHDHVGDYRVIASEPHDAGNPHGRSNRRYRLMSNGQAQK